MLDISAECISYLFSQCTQVSLRHHSACCHHMMPVILRSIVRRETLVNKRKWKVQALLAIVVLVSGCTAELQVFDDEENTIDGVPFRAPVLYVMQGDYTKHKKLGSNCEHNPFTKFVSLPLGEQYFLTADPGPLSGSEFSVTFTNNGLLKHISLNSESTFSETLDSITKLVSEGFPILGVDARPSGQAEPAAIAGVTNGAKPACDTGEKTSSMTLLEHWLESLE